MGLFDALKSFVDAVNHEYDRRVKAASNVKEYDPTGTLHHHGHVEVQNEQVVAVEDGTGAHDHDAALRPAQPSEQTAPRHLTHR